MRRVPSSFPVIRTNETGLGMRLSESPFPLFAQSIICTTTIILWQFRNDLDIMLATWTHLSVTHAASA